MQKFMELPKLKMGCALFNEFLLNKSVNIYLHLKTQHNIYGICCNHLVPIAINPLITPFSLAIDSSSLLKAISGCNSLNIIKENDDLIIKCDKIDYNLIALPIHEIEVINHECAQHELINMHEMGMYIEGNFSTLISIMNIIGIFLTLLDHGEILVLRKLIHELNYDIIVNDNKLARYILSNSGLGSGSTPSSDDFIIGLLVSRLKRMNTELAEVVDKINTTLLSKKLITEVLLDPCYIINLCRILMLIINGGNLDEIINDIVSFIRVGGFSGIFMLTGLVTGIAINDKELLSIWKIILNKYLGI